MFDDIRDTLRSLSGRLDPDERRRMTAGMRDALIHAKLGIKELQTALSTTDTRLAAERTELDTVRRRQGYAADIGDTETVAIAERFAQQHAERVAVLESKRMAQQQELDLAEREYETMSAELRRIMSGAAPQAATPDMEAKREVDALLSDDPLDGARSTAGDEPPARRTRADRQADADARLAEMKRRLGM
jgi:multidrug resistance efflux pump